MPADQTANLCQLAVKAGKTIRGKALIDAIQKRTAILVLVSEACGDNTRKKLLDKSKTYGVELIELPDARFQQIVPFPSNAFALADAGFAQAVKKRLNPEKTMNM